MTIPNIPAVVEPQPIEVEGRLFYPSQDTSFEQDIYAMSVIRGAGLEKLAESFDITRVDILDQVAQDIIITAFAHGKLFEMLGAVLEEENVPWSIEGAKDNSAFFSQLRNKKDKEALHGAIVSVILGFFVSGLLSSARSKNSSTPVTLTPAEPSSSGIGLPKFMHEDTTTSVPGISSSGNSATGENQSTPGS